MALTAPNKYIFRKIYKGNVNIRKDLKSLKKINYLLKLLKRNNSPQNKTHLNK